MAPNTTRSKRRTEQLESPFRNKRCMEDRKTTIVDPQLRAHYTNQPPTTGILEAVWIKGMAFCNDVARSISETFARMPFQLHILHSFVNCLSHLSPTRY